jgi:hypothetical protein
LNEPPGAASARIFSSSYGTRGSLDPCPLYSGRTSNTLSRPDAEDGPKIRQFGTKSAAVWLNAGVTRRHWHAMIALGIRRDIPQVLGNRGNALRNLGRFDEAETSLREALRF